MGVFMTECIREYKGMSLTDFIQDYVVVDIETTGLSPKVNEIIEIGAIKVKNGAPVETFQTLVKCSGGIPENIKRKTGITDEMLDESGIPLDEAIKAFDSFAGDSIFLGHNVNFDINFLYDAFENILGKPLPNDFVDTYKLARSLVKDTYSHKLSTLAKKFDIENRQAHRALSDCFTTIGVYQKLKYVQDNFVELRLKQIAKTLKEDPLFKNAKVAIKAKLKYVEEPVLVELLRQMESKAYFAFYKSCNVLIVDENAYQRLQETLDPNDEYLKFFCGWMYKAQERMKAGDLTIVTELDFCNRLGIPTGLSKERDESNPFFGKICVFTGTLDRMSRKQAEKIVSDIGGVIGNGVTKKTNYLILGNNDYNMAVKDGKSAKHKRAEELQLQGYEIEIIPEDHFYELIGED